MGNNTSLSSGQGPGGSGGGSHQYRSLTPSHSSSSHHHRSTQHNTLGGRSSSTHRTQSGSRSTAQTPTGTMFGESGGFHVLRSAQSWSSLHDAQHQTPQQQQQQHHHQSNDHNDFSYHPLPPVPSKSDTVTTKKKRNLTSLATLRKKLVRKARRTSKSFDHGQVLRDFLSGWSTRDLMHLCEEYESQGLMRDLMHQADIARPGANTVSSDLVHLYDLQYCADTYLLFRGVHFPVHKAVVCVRCPFLRELLGKINTFGARVPVHLEISGLRPELFNDLLRFLYSGKLVPTLTDLAANNSYDSVLNRLKDQFGLPSDLDRDLKHLLETGLYSDASLIFSGDTPHQLQQQHMNQVKKCRACSDQGDFSCHSVILAARSPFFRNVVQRHQRRFAQLTVSEHQVNTANQKMRIVLDESVIPRRFGRILLHAMYRDHSSELASLLPQCVCRCAPLNHHNMMDAIAAASASASVANTSKDMGTLTSQCSMHSATSSLSIGSTSTLTNSNQHHTHSNSLSSFGSLLTNGSATLTSNKENKESKELRQKEEQVQQQVMIVQEVMNLYEIARFLELDSLITSCEDLMVEYLSVDTLPHILSWSSQSHASHYVQRQALHFLREEFTAIIASPALLNLESNHLLHGINSDYLQASELEVLTAVIRWGEHRLSKRMEDREPNVVSQTAHSLRRGVRKKELNDAELRDVISELMGHVRIGHILPLDSELLTDAAKRGLISTLPPYMLGEDNGVPYVRGITSWLRGKGSGPFVPPRYFTPYVEEAKSYLDERMRRPGEMSLLPRRGDRTAAITHHPDTLYMVDKPGSLDVFHHMTTSTSSEIYSSCCPPHPLPPPAVPPRNSMPSTSHGNAHQLHHPSCDSHPNNQQHHSRDRSSAHHHKNHHRKSSNASSSSHHHHHSSSSSSSTHNEMSHFRNQNGPSIPPPIPPKSSVHHHRSSSHHNRHHQGTSSSSRHHHHHHQSSSSQDAPPLAPPSQLPVIEQRILVLMKQREQELKGAILGTMAVVPNRSEVTKMIHLRVVREYGLPDAASEVLHNTANYIPFHTSETETTTDDMTATYGVVGMCPSSGVLSNVGSNGALQSEKDIYCFPSEMMPIMMEHETMSGNESPIPPPLPPNGESYLHYSFEDEYLGGRQGVRDTMPDIALATSALAEMHLFKRSTESLALQPPPPQRPSLQPAGSSSFESSSGVHFLP